MNEENQESNVSGKKLGTTIERAVSSPIETVKNLINNSSDNFKDEEQRAAKLTNDKLQQELNDIKVNRYIRGGMIVAILWFEIWYIKRVLNIVDNDAILFGYQLSDSVMIALLTTTTANMLALLAFIIKYLFPQRK